MGLTQSDLKAVLDSYKSEFGEGLEETIRDILKESGFTYTHVSALEKGKTFHVLLLYLRHSTF